jgi:hypothetical protein
MILTALLNHQLKKNSIVQSRSSETNSRSASQVIAWLFYYTVGKFPVLALVLIYMKLILLAYM